MHGYIEKGAVTGAGFVPVVFYCIYINNNIITDYLKLYIGYLLFIDLLIYLA